MYLPFMYGIRLPHGLTFSEEEQRSMRHALWVLVIGEVIVLSPLVLLFF